MTTEKLYDTLAHILSEVSQEEYPELCRIIHSCIDPEDEIVYCEEDVIADQLMEADQTKPLPACVASFLVESYQEATESGNADAACNLGALYYTGRAGEQNYEKAVKYYTIAAEGGCRQAQENLGYCYYYGRNIPVDHKKAFHYFALGAFDGHLRSLYKIGDMYRNGYYVAKNEIEAFRIYSWCEQNISIANRPLVGADIMMRLSDCYFSGIGTEINYKLALNYYQQAEQLFIERLENGDFMIRRGYDHVVCRQAEARCKLEASLPSYDWAKQP